MLLFWFNIISLYSFIFLVLTKCVNSLPGELGQAGWVRVSTGARPGQAWSPLVSTAIGGLTLAPAPTLRQTRIVHVRHPRHSFPFRCSFFLFPLSVLYITLDVFGLLAVCMVTILCLYIGVIGVFYQPLLRL